MKVVYLINQYPKISHTFIRREILSLEAQGIEVFRVSSRPGPEGLIDDLDRAEEEKTIYLVSKPLNLMCALANQFLRTPLAVLNATAKAIRMSRNAGGGLVRHFAYLLQAASLANFCRKNSVEHVHAHFATNPTTIALLCSKLKGPKYSFTIHGPEEFDRPEALSLQEKIEDAAAVVAITSYCRSQLYRWCSYEHWRKISIVHCCVENEYLERPTAPQPEQFSLLSIGRLSEQKGQLLLVEALAVARDKGVQVNCKIVGDGEFRSRIEEEISVQGLESNIELLGWRSGNDILDLIDASSVLILPSFAEGLPVVIMESLARARPAITTYIAGIPELVEKDSNGWLIPAGDAIAIADAVASATNMGPENLDEMGQIGRERVRESHWSATEASKLISIFSDSTKP